MQELTPRQIVEKLDEHIVGQDDAKRAVAIALRNRWRWKQLPDDIRREVTPKNIIMIGPTGVGKTEITRRLAFLTGAPLVKVEATKFTEVGYVGRDVESMIRDLLDVAIRLVKTKQRDEVAPRAQHRVEDRLLDLLLPKPDRLNRDEDAREAEARHARTREKFREMLRSGQMEDRKVELSVEQRNVPVQIFSNMGMEQMDVDFQNMFEKIMPKTQQKRELPVSEARKLLMDQEIDALIDQDAVNAEAIELAEQQGIVFVDEIDKVCGPDESSKSVDVSRQGVQRDLLPIVEGTTVQTRYGNVKTDHMLFIAAGAFHRARPADLMPELQGRFPIRVELQPLTRDDFLRILTEPTGSITRQYQALLETDGVKVVFEQDGLEAIADIGWQVNQTTQNIGARRLHTILERLLEDASFEGPEIKGQTITVNAEYVHEKLDAITQVEDLSKFIL
ncbi:MAG: ATP-dependent protease ATPase subunit HslU [Planctomycetota bacterium]|nr:MAG: ATP-dependent protease ATPase subunit HslU [Planctomycetota bacterium]REK20971.1 MAG: ATP-dependent protease ATPase subunit HslU [Planctomycetota bacterium]REK37247.1 MAG: ATP-dependent protease ATPase subunit HslU [Planctomycetota bacterium]